jgi:predicted nuclease with TOPRIM domain
MERVTNDISTYENEMNQLQQKFQMIKTELLSLTQEWEQVVEKNSCGDHHSVATNFNCD